MNYDLVLICTTLLYLIQFAVLLRAVLRTRDQSSHYAQPFVSVIIAARNEEDNIAGCLESVLQQTYPRSLFEVIVMDDNSTDKTKEICGTYQNRFSHLEIATAVEHGGPIRGKTNALQQGITLSRGTIVLITDADCVVPATWIEATLRRYNDNVGLVGGMTLQHSTTSFEGMQSLDWAYLLGIASAGVTMRNPLSTIGNNLSFRRSAYDSIGGYGAIRFSVTEDYALFQGIVKTGRWEYLYPIDPEILVMSKPCRSMKELLRQKHRWAKGGLDMKPFGFLIMAIGFLHHVAILFSLWYWEPLVGAMAFVIKCSADYFFLKVILNLLKRPADLRFFPAFALYYFIYILVLPLAVVLGGRVIWKGRAY